MNRLKSSVLVVLAAAMLIGLSVIPSAPVEAQGSAALSIAPRKNYTIEPGKAVSDTLLVRNIDRERPLNLTMRVVDFTYTNDGGTPKLMLDENLSPTTWSLRSFIDAPESITIAPGESESVEMTVTIPENQGAGSYYSAIVYSSGASEGGNVGLSASGVTLVFVTVPGEMHEKLTLKKIGSYDPNILNNDDTRGAYTFFNTVMPKRIGFTLENSGNVAEAPVGSMMLRNIFGQEKTINDINPNRFLALIGQTRTFDPCIMLAKEQVEFDGNRQEATTCADAGLWPGFYTVTIDGFYGQNGNNTQEFSGKGRFIYAPWWFIIAVIVVVALVAYHVRRIVLHFKGGKSGGKKRAPRGTK